MVKINPSVLARFKTRTGGAVTATGPVRQDVLAANPRPAIDPVKKPKSSKKIGRDRAEIVSSDEPAMEFYIDLSHDPRPKKRPRTMMNMKVVGDAFLAARGNLNRFKALLRDPVTNKSRAQVTITPKDTVEYEDFIRKEVRAALGGRLPFEGPVKAEMLFVLKGDRKFWPTSPADGDADNLEKAAADALNEIAFKDDRFVVVTTRYKICRAKPGILLWLSPAQPTDLEHPMVLAWDARAEA
jgi:Holliday junction resolvase RusA-like endonuclease